jgi:hypothetical protein
MTSQCDGTLPQKVLCFSKFITVHLVEIVVKEALPWAIGVHKDPIDPAAWWEKDGGQWHTQEIFFFF